ncbi:hypothetical protein ACEN4P_12760, partial [Marinilactibacillus psychrotolerans]
QEQCEAWLERTGNYKVHEKTKKRPIDVFTLEKPHLISISKKRILSNNESITKTILKDNCLWQNKSLEQCRKKSITQVLKKSPLRAPIPIA